MPGIRPIKEKILEANYLFALLFREGYVFGRTVRRRICQYEPYALIKSDGTAVDIGPLAHQAELRFRDPRNPDVDILYLVDTTNSGDPWFFHGSIGIMPQQIFMYPRFPEGSDIPGKFPNVDPIKPNAGDLLGYVNSLKSPYLEPTDYVEYVITPKLHLGAEYNNKDSERSHQPVLNLFFALYWFKPLRLETNARLISRIALREVPASFLTVGFGDLPQDMGDTLMKDWGVAPMSLEKAVGGR